MRKKETGGRGEGKGVDRGKGMGGKV